MSKREQLEQAIAHLETQRGTLGDVAVDAALARLRQQLATMDHVAIQGPREPMATALAGERKLVTVMFADISGFTALSEKMDPESVRDLINACFERLVPIVEKYGGTVDKFIGDAIMALFGAPVAHENDPERALRSALEMRDALAVFSAEHGLDLGIHFGINTGLVIAGAIGTSARREYSVMGDAVNLASRLEEVSERDEILVGQDTHHLTTSLFTFEPLEPIRVTGKAEPVQVYRLVVPVDELGRVRGLESRGIRCPLERAEERGPGAPPLLAGERKFVTVMFADISGFTALLEKIDPESVRDSMNACFERLVPIVEKYGGTVDKFIGDEIMALFGAPVAHENDPERALRSALEMRDALAVFSAEHGLDLGIHFGINTGLVIAGGLGTSERQEYSVMGDAVNLASRLGGLSEQGEILVGQDTYRPAEPLFTFEPLEPIRVKGKAEPVQVYRLVGLKARPGRVRGLERRGISSSLVGRDAEFAAINGCVDRLLGGQGGIISIVGEAGIGKSRLMAEIRDAVSGESVCWLEGRTLSFSKAISYWPFQEILWQVAGITDEDSESVAWDRLESRVRDLFPENTPEILPYLATLLSLEVKGAYAERVRYLSGEAMGHQVFLTSRRFFEQLARAQPTVLVFEDLHWVDESSAALLEHLLPLVESVPLLIIAVSRPDPESPAARMRETTVRGFAHCTTEILLAPLSDTNGAQLVHNLLDIEHFPPRMQEAIIRKAEGNPFFLEEIIRGLIDAGAVVRDPTTGQWQATAQVGTITIPDTVQGVVIARVDRLEEDIKQVLTTASVIGRSFLYRVLHTVMEAGQQLDEHLSELQAIELIREKRQMPELEYIFKHALAQEATYNSLLLRRRRELHALVGQAIEELASDRMEEFYGLLAYHYAQAETWEKAQEYLLKAGDQAGRVAADAEALAHYEQAMTAYERVFGDQWDPFQRATLERKMGEALFRRGEHERAIESLQRALVYLDCPFPTSPWPIRLGIARQVIRQIGNRLLPGVFLRHAPDEPNPVIEEWMSIFEIMAWMDYYLNQERFLLETIWLLNLAEQENSPFRIVHGYTAAGLICDTVPLSRRAGLYYNRRAIALAEEIQHPAALGTTYFTMGLHWLYLKACDEMTFTYFSKAAEVFWEMGNLREWGTMIPLLHWVYLLRGELTHSAELCHELIRIGQDVSDSQMWGWGLHGLGRIGQRAGSFDEATEHLQKAIDIYKAIPDYLGQTDATGELGICYLRQGKLEQALVALKEGHHLVVERGLLGHQVVPLYVGLAAAYLIAVEQAGEREKRNWLKKARRACRVALKQGEFFRYWLPHALRLQGQYEWLRGKPIAAQKWWQRSRVVSEELGMRYELGMTCLEMGLRMGEHTYLKQAETMFAEIGAEWDLGRTREALEG